MSSKIEKQVEALNFWVLSNDCPWRRVYPGILENNKFDDFDQKFDNKTFIYDVFYRKDRVVVICPKLFNFEELYRETRFYIDDILTEPILRRYFQYDQIELKVPKADNLKVENSCGSKQFDLPRSLPDIFKGLNCIVTVNRNNRLEWIRDFVDYYIKQHKLEGLLLVDNQSTNYSLEDVGAILARSKLKNYRLVSAPFLFGPVLKDRSSSPQSLQIAMFNAARQFYLQKARAVLNVDIDELVAPLKHNIFDLAQKSIFNIVRFKGYWRYTDQINFDRIAHKHHFLRKKQDSYCPHKYCYVPSKFIEKLPLDWHGFSINNVLMRKFLHLLINRPDVRFWHCSGLTTRWKGDRLATSDNLVTDSIMRETMSKCFNEETE
ncbi:MAG: hypothetical protein D3919_05605 [Candidatus Electrothrix sp. AW5]|nr:hypothetical protein [Candidatus Electrothrix gigas]